ncbi:MAG TPA: TIGR02588 family protein [Herpetosiphonaceae bacterium]
MSQATQAADKSRTQTTHERSLAEWVTFGVATLVLITIVSLVIYDWVATPNTPPVIELTQSGEIRQVNGQYYIPFTIKNIGGNTAEAVQLIAELKIDGEVEESGEQQIDFLAGDESEEGAFVFNRNPGEGELILRVGSYKMP